MKRFFSFLLVFLLGFVGFISLVWAQELPDAFIVEANPSSFDVNEAVDLTISAVKNNWETVLDYEWDVFIELLGVIDPDDYIVPSDGLYTFLPQDQWVKLFSKWLKIKIPDTFTLAVSDIIDETIQGKMTLIVGEISSQEEKSVSIVSPVANAIETSDDIEILAQAPDLPNSTYQIYLNEILAAEWISTEKWDISDYISNALAGQNTLQIKVVDINGLVIGESALMNFNYKTASDSIFNGMEILPSTQAKQWQKLTFTVNTSELVSSAILKLSDWQSFPMDNDDIGRFTKQLVVTTVWVTSISLSLNAWWNQKIYNDVASFVVDANVGVSNLKFYTDGVDFTKMSVTRDTMWPIAKYKVAYGTAQNNLSQNFEVWTNEILLENLNPEQDYFIQITPLDDLGSIYGDISTIEQVQPWHLWPQTAWEAPNCVVQWIALYTGRIWNKYYLSRNAVENTQRYIIYRSDFPTTNLSDMNKVWESTDNRFEYPFNFYSNEDQFAYYAVQAICSNGAALQIDDVKRVHVWPIDNLLFVVVLSLFAYVSFRLYKVAKD